MLQAEADTELTLSASPATAVGEQTLTLANRRYSTLILKNEMLLEKTRQKKKTLGIGPI